MEIITAVACVNNTAHAQHAANIECDWQPREPGPLCLRGLGNLLDMD